MSSFLLCASIVAPVHAECPVDNALSVVEECVADPCVAWPIEWQQGYLDTIREALACDYDRPDYRTRIEIFRCGFPLYWNGCRMARLTPVEYEMFRAEMRWYCETLVTEELPTEFEKTTLKAQIHGLCDYASEYLSAQFPFFSEPYLQEGKRVALRELDEKLQAPLLPIYRRPLSQGQQQVIRDSWASLYMRWYSLWREVRYGTSVTAACQEPNEVSRLCQCEFVRRCLRCLPNMIWTSSSKPPGYVLDAFQRLSVEKADKARQYDRVRQQEIGTPSRSRNQIEQIEQWSFIFTELFEMGMPRECQRSSCFESEEGGGVYELRRE